MFANHTSMSNTSTVVEYKWWHVSVVPYDIVDNNISQNGCANFESTCLILSLSAKLGIPSLRCTILSLRKFQVGAEHTYIYLLI